MRLRAKTLSVVGLTMTVLFVVLFGAANLMLSSRYREIEAREAASAAARAAHGLEDGMMHLDDMASLIAARNDTFAFMESGGVQRVEDTLGEVALSRQGISFAILLDKDGHASFTNAVDLDVESRVEVSPELISSIEGASYLRTPGDPRGFARGLMRLPDGVAVISARPVTTSDMYSPPNGTLVVGRFLDDAWIGRISRSTGLEIAAFDPPQELPQAAVQTGSAEQGATRAVWWEPFDGDTLHAFSVVDDVRGRPALMLRVELARDTKASLASAIAYAGISLVFIGVGATVAVQWLVDWAVLRRLTLFSRQVREIGRKGDSSARVEGVAEDELGDLATSVNGMLASLEAADNELRRSRDELEDRVARRTHELNLSEARHRELVERMADAVFSVGLDGRVTLVNGRAVELLGRPRTELVGADFVELMAPGSRDAVRRLLSGDPQREDNWTVETLIESQDGETIPIELRGSPFGESDQDVAGTQWIARDITERRRFEQELVYLAEHDHLTGLANRRSFEAALEVEITEALRSGEQGAVVWLDLDDFKDINDTLGHAAGDEVLVMLSSVLERNLRSGNLLARTGGDEFAVLMPRVSRREASSGADRILSALSSFTCTLDGRSVRLGASAGVVFFPESGTSVQEVMSHADAAMYCAKERGRSLVHVSEVAEQTERLRSSRMFWNERITAALREGSFVVCAQPILDLRTDELVRHELLIRLMGENGELHPPSDFLPAAERLGLITAIDRWMVRRAIAILEADDGSLPAVEVNLSGKAFADTGLLKLTADEIVRSGIDPRRLGFEITETAAIADMARARLLIASLKELGCRFSLDDFGSGFSSFYYLKHLPVDCLKIDGSYIRGLAQSEQDRCLVRGIQEMCRGLGIEVLAECIEDQDALDAARMLGLDYAQGYHIGRPAQLAEPASTEVS